MTTLVDPTSLFPFPPAVLSSVARRSSLFTPCSPPLEILSYLSENEKQT